MLTSEMKLVLNKCGIEFNPGHVNRKSMYDGQSADRMPRITEEQLMAIAKELLREPLAAMESLAHPDFQGWQRRQGSYIGIADGAEPTASERCQKLAIVAKTCRRLLGEA